MNTIVGSQAESLGRNLSEHRSIVALATESNRRNSEASLAVCGQGHYLLAYTAFSESPRDDSDAMIVAATSQDFGRSWEDPQPIAIKEEGINVMSPSLLVLKDGSIALGFIGKYSMRHARILWTRSFDHGKTWAPVSTIYDVGEFTICLNDVLILLQSGRIIFPLYERLPGQEPWCDDEQLRAFCIYSDDCGATWQRSEGWITCPGHGAMEPFVYETAPGHLVMHLRTNQGKLWRSESKDNGHTWDQAIPTRLETPEAPAVAKRRPNTGEIFMIRNPRYMEHLPAGGARNPLVLSVSHDNGLTWSENDKVLESDPRGTFSYPSITFDEDFLLITYYLSSFRVSLSDQPGLKFSLCFRRIPYSEL